MMRKNLSPPGSPVEGIILSAFPFEETSYILNVFSSEWGRIKLVAKQSGRKQLQSYSTLLAIEAITIPSEKELWKCRECFVSRSYPKLRLKLETLHYGAKISDFLAKTVPLHLPMPVIYDLFAQFLECLPGFTYPHVAATAFLAKFCIHEGLFPAKKESHLLFSQEEINECILLASNDLKSLSAKFTEKDLLSKLIDFVLI